MKQEWTESGTIDTGVTLAFDGLNLDEQDALEVENFGRSVQEVAKEDPGGKAFAKTKRSRNRAISPRDAVQLALGVGFAFVAFSITAELNMDEGPGYAIVLGAGVLGMATPSIVMALMNRKAVPVVRRTNESFRITVSREAFVAEGERMQRVEIPTAEIDRLDAERRVTVHRKDGGAVPLVCGLKSKCQPPLAARLSALVAEAQARL